jgi:hypothetical protein
MYFASIDERAIVGYFLLTQFTAPFVNTNANPIVDLLESKFPP